MARLSISEAWVETRERLRRDGNLFVTVALALLVLPQTLAGLIAPDGRVTGGAAPLMLAAALVSLVGQIALVRLATGPSASVGEAIGHGARRLLPTLAALILFGALIILLALPFIMAMIALGWIDPEAATPTGAAAGSFGLALLLLVVLAVALSVRLMLILPVSSAEGGGPLHLLRRSWRLTADHYARLLGLLLMLVVAALALMFVGAILGGIAARLAGGDAEPMSLAALIAAATSAAAQAAFTILSSVMLARTYLQLAGRGPAAASVPSSGT